MNKEWEKYKVFLIEVFPAYAQRLNVPAEILEIRQFGTDVDIILPQDFIDIYTVNNGEVTSYRQKNEWGIVCGSKMLTLNEIYDYNFEDFLPDKCVPVLKDKEEDFFIGINVSDNNYGEISTYARYKKTTSISVAPSISDFFNKINKKILSGYFSCSVYKEMKNENGVNDIREYFEHNKIYLAELFN